MKPTYWIISAAITVAGLCTAAAGMKMLHQEQNVKAASTPQIEEHFSSIEDLDIDLGSSLLKITEDKNAADITVRIIDPIDGMIVEQDGSTLIIKEKDHISIFDFNPVSKQMQTLVTVPAGTQFKSVDVEIGSGDIPEMSGFKAQTVDVDLGSGNAGLQQLEIADSCTLHSGSGTLSIGQSTISGDVRLDTGSGNMYLEECKLQKDAETKCGSGSLTVNATEIKGDMTSHFGSGNLKGADLTIGGEADWDFGSGSAKIENFDPGKQTKVDMGSGNVEFSLVGKQSDYWFDTSELSGNITIGNQKMSRAESIGDSSALKKICIDGGSGNVVISFLQ